MQGRIKGRVMWTPGQNVSCVAASVQQENAIIKTPHPLLYLINKYSNY